MLLKYLLLALAFFSTRSQAVDCGGTPIRLAFYDFGLLYNNGKGIDKDVVDELRIRSGCRFDFYVLPRARIWQELETGQLDMSVSGIQNPERDRFAWFAPYMALKNIAITAVSADKHSATTEHFLAQQDYKWGAVRAFKHGETADRFLTRMRQQNRVIEGSDVAQIFAMLKAGRVQGIFAQSPVYRQHLEPQMLPSQFQLHDWAPDENPVPHALILAKSRFSAEQAEQWRKLADDLVRDGTMLRILRRYLQADEATAQMLSHKAQKN